MSARLARVLDSLRDLVEDAARASADRELSVPELVELAGDVADLGLAILACAGADPERRRRRREERRARREARG